MRFREGKLERKKEELERIREEKKREMDVQDLCASISF